MTTLTQKQRKKDFHHITHNILELLPKDSAYQLLTALTKNARLSIFLCVKHEQMFIEESKTHRFQGRYPSI